MTQKQEFGERAGMTQKQEFGGGGEIRTLGRLLTYAGFQDRCNQPLCHPSGAGHVTSSAGVFKHNDVSTRRYNQAAKE